MALRAAPRTTSPPPFRCAGPRPPGAWALAALLASPGALGCSDLLGFSGFHALCGPEPGAEPGARAWMTRLGDDASQKALGVAADSDGNVLVTGAFEGTLDAGGDALQSLDKKDAFLLKLDPDGRQLWSKRFGGRGHQYGTHVAADSAGNAIVTGRYNGEIDFCGDVLASNDEKDTDGSTTNDEGKDDVDTDIFLAKLDPDGNCVWNAVFGATFEQASRGLAVGAGGDIYLTGSFVGALDLRGKCKPMKSAADTDFFVAAFSPGGECQWTHQQDFGGADTGEDVAVDDAGRVRAVGSCTQGNIMPCDSYAGRNILLTSIDAGELTTQSFNGDGDEVGLGIASSEGAGIVITGTFDGTLDFGTASPLSGAGGDIFLASLDVGADGQILGPRWSQRFGGVGRQTANAVAASPDGVIALAGAYEGSLDFGAGPLPAVEAASNAFAAAFDKSGAPLWSRGFGDGKSGTSAAAVALDGKGNVLIAGSLDGSASCGDDAEGGTLTSAGQSDVWLVKLKLQ